MSFCMRTCLYLLLLTKSVVSPAQITTKYNAVYSGIPWYDDKGNIVSAHGACIIKDGDRFYLFGERHHDTSNAFAGFNCYSSADLYNWKFEKLVLPVQDTGRLGPRRVGERVKVMKCPKTGGYVMYMHTDNLLYKDQCVGYATSKTITGTYTFQGPLLFEGKPVRKWDMGTFQDSDGAGYLLLHGGDLYKLADDYKSLTEHVIDNKWRGSESPAVFKKDSLYYWLASDLTSWERNDNFYYTATSLKGPWTYRGYFAPAGTLTWNSQTTFVLPVAGSGGNTYLFMGDRWSFPKQASAATYVWQPLTVEGGTLSMPAWHSAWQLNRATGLVSPVTIAAGTTMTNTDKRIAYRGNWQYENSDTSSVSRSDEKGASFTVPFSGKQIGFYSLKGPAGGYAHVTLKNRKGKEVLSAIIDMYCKYPATNLAFLSPVLPKGNYILNVTVMGERCNWSDKRKSDYGSTGYFISLDKVIIND